MPGLEIELFGETPMLTRDGVDTEPCARACWILGLFSESEPCRSWEIDAGDAVCGSGGTGGCVAGPNGAGAVTGVLPRRKLRVSPSERLGTLLRVLLPLRSIAGAFASPGTGGGACLSLIHI